VARLKPNSAFTWLPSQYSGKYSNVGFSPPGTSNDGSLTRFIPRGSEGHRERLQEFFSCAPLLAPPWFEPFAITAGFEFLQVGAKIHDGRTVNGERLKDSV
jgi:hypothetical protein